LQGGEWDTSLPHGGLAERVPTRRSVENAVQKKRENQSGGGAQEGKVKGGRIPIVLFVRNTPPGGGSGFLLQPKGRAGSRRARFWI